MPKKGAAEGELQGRKVAPRGHFVVYVGSEMKRFVVPTYFLKNPCFLQLLDRAAEEYGFDGRNEITLPCDEPTFQTLIALLSKK
ncbi:UNVERIFIED_CONTAM: Indole-3-acetic acid-induced protein ARG7 [Sesamum calycinum]|uniref:Indole-3-acetic acid-induced protein ARG7 n=1 Tax=Sesamum calycinum TaxID=2727403 RepID=A0AAW2P7V2_9LAMI